MPVIVNRGSSFPTTSIDAASRVKEKLDAFSKAQTHSHSPGRSPSVAVTYDMCRVEALSELGTRPEISPGLSYFATISPDSTAFVDEMEIVGSNSNVIIWLISRRGILQINISSMIE